MRNPILRENVILEDIRLLKGVFVRFMGYQEAFDTILHDIMIYLLQQLGADSKDIEIIWNLY